MVAPAVAARDGGEAYAHRYFLWFMWAAPEPYAQAWRAGHAAGLGQPVGEVAFMPPTDS